MDRKRLKKKFFSSYWFILVFVLVFLLRLPLLFEPFTYADEGIYLTLGQAIRKGLVLYRDIHDNKPPMLYLIAAIGGNFNIYRLIHFFWSFITIFIFYKLSRSLFSKNRLAIIISTSVFAILTSLHTFEGNIANAENFMILPIIIAFYLILTTIPHNHFYKRWFVAGVLFSLAVLFKIPAIFDFAAAIILLFLINQKRSISSNIQSLAFSIFGFLLPIFITILYFAYQNALPQYLSAAFSQNLPYLSSWGGSNVRMGGLPLTLIFRTLVVFSIIILLFLFRKKISLTVKVIITWFSFSLFATLLSSRPYPHYLIQVLPSFSLAFGLFALDKTKKWLKSIPIFLVLIFVLTFISFRFWYYPNLPYLVNFYQFAFSIKSRQDYFSNFDKQALSLYEAAAFIKTHTTPQEKIFIWGNQPSIYALARRLPVGRYTVAYHIIDFKAQQETFNALRFQPPPWLIISQDENQAFPQLEDFIDDDYLLFQKYGQIKIFYRLPKLSQL